MSYFQRLTLALREGALVATKGSPLATLKWLRRRLFSASESLLMVKDSPFPEPALPSDVRIVAITPSQYPAMKEDVVRGGAGLAVANFQSGAVCFLAYVKDEPAAVGWRFSESRLLQRLGLGDEAVYLGGFFVRDEFRGRGLYRMLLQTICSTSLGTEQQAFAEVSELNAPSVRGLQKAGFRPAGTLKVTACVGFIIRCRLTSNPDRSKLDAG